MNDASHVHYQIRIARPDDAEQIAPLFRLAYESSSHPCKTEAFVADTLRQTDTNLWVVGDHDGRIAGCMGMLRHAWNRSWEIGRGVTHPDFRGGGLATALCRYAIDVTRSSPDCDLIVGFPRSSTMVHIVSELVRPAMTIVGHDDGINVAGGRREYHLICLWFNRAATFERRVPNGPSAATHRFVQSAVTEPLGLAATRGPYPDTLIAGNRAHHPDYGPFTFEYHPFCPSDALEITGYTGSKSDPAAIASDLVRTIESFGYARHVRLAVLADKNEFCGALCAQGFAVTAYLPAWDVEDGVRYDCVLLTRRTTDTEPVDHGTRDLIDHFNQGYLEWSRSISTLQKL